MADSDGIEPHRTGEVRRETVALRRLRMSDAAAVHEAFASAGDMARQGDVTTAEGAERYVARLLEAGSSHEAWAIVEADELIGLIGVTVDEENRSGWFWYWMTHRARGRGLTRRPAAAVAEWALTERGKFLIDGQRIDVETYGRLRVDPAPEFDTLPLLIGL